MNGVPLQASKQVCQSRALLRMTDDTIDEDSPPFTWKRLSLRKLEEEQLGDIELGVSIHILSRSLTPHSPIVQAWVVDILDHKHIATMLKQVRLFLEIF